MLEVDYPVKQKVESQKRCNENSGQKTLLERKKILHEMVATGYCESGITNSLSSFENETYNSSNLGTLKR